MAKITLYFNKWSRQKLALKLKQCTTRTYRAGKAGDNFFVGMTEFVLTDVMQTSLAVVMYDFYEEEGAESQEEFLKVWMDVNHKKDWNPDQKVFLHWFKELKINYGGRVPCQQ